MIRARRPQARPIDSSQMIEFCHFRRARFPRGKREWGRGRMIIGSVRGSAADNRQQPSRRGGACEGGARATALLEIPASGEPSHRRDLRLATGGSSAWRVFWKGGTLAGACCSARGAALHSTTSATLGKEGPPLRTMNSVVPIRPAPPPPDDVAAWRRFPKTNVIWLGRTQMFGAGEDGQNYWSLPPNNRKRTRAGPKNQWRLLPKNARLGRRNDLSIVIAVDGHQARMGK